MITMMMMTIIIISRYKNSESIDIWIRENTLEVLKAFLFCNTIPEFIFILITSTIKNVSTFHVVF